MIPTILSLGPIPINSFGLMVALAIVAGIFRLQRSFVLEGLAAANAERYVMVGGISGLLGARIWYLVTFWNEIQGDLWGAATSRGGFVFFGGFLFATIVLVALLIRDKVPLHSFFDCVGPTMALGYAIGRVGCQLSGDGDYGLPTDSWIGMSYATGVVPTPPGVLVYPTPLFESCASLLILWAITAAEYRAFWRAPWRRLSLYLALIAVERFVVEFWRRNARVDIAGFQFSEAQWISVMILFAAFAFFFLSRFSHGRSGVHRGTS